MDADLDTLATALYARIDDTLKDRPELRPWRPKVGIAPKLSDAELVILEVSFFKFFEAGPECADVIAYMNRRGFVPYDVVGRQYRPLDGALSQADIAFVREDGMFRRQHAYATADQRQAQNRQMQKYLDQVFAGHRRD